MAINVNVTGPQEGATQQYKTVVLKPNMVTEGTTKRNILTQERIDEHIEEGVNTKFVIKWDYDLDNQPITLPNDTIIYFDGGSFSNGTLIGFPVTIEYLGELSDVLNEVNLSGIFNRRSLNLPPDNITLQNNNGVLEVKDSGLTSEKMATTFVDDEDIHFNENGSLQLKDRTSTQTEMCYVILRKDKTFAEQIINAPTIYEIRYMFDLGESGLYKNVTIGTATATQIDGTTYYYSTIPIPQGKALYLNNSECVLLNGEATALLGKNYVLGEDDNTVVNIAATATGTYNFVYRIEDYVSIPEYSVLKFNGGYLNDGLLYCNKTIFMGNIIFSNVDVVGTHNKWSEEPIDITDSIQFVPGDTIFFPEMKKLSAFDGGAFLEYDGMFLGIPRSGSSNERPDNFLWGLCKGFEYFDTDLDKAIFWDGSKWVDENGSNVNVVTASKGGFVRRDGMADDLSNVNAGLRYYDTDLNKYITWGVIGVENDEDVYGWIDESGINLANVDRIKGVAGARDIMVTWSGRHITSANEGLRFYDESLKKYITFASTNTGTVDGYQCENVTDSMDLTPDDSRINLLNYNITNASSLFTNGTVYSDTDVEDLLNDVSTLSWPDVNGQYVIIGVSELSEASSSETDYYYYKFTKTTATTYYNRWVDETGTDLVNVTLIRGTSDQRVELATQSALRPNPIAAANAGLRFYDTTLNKYTVWTGSKWIEEDGAVAGVARDGAFSVANALTSADIYTGFKFFCTSGASLDGGTTQKTNIPIYYTGSGWVDANGTAVVAFNG